VTGTLPERAVRPTGVRFAGFGWRPVGRSRPVLDGIDLIVQPGERVLVAGPSGAGKSTLLQAAAGVLGADMEGDRAGEVVVDGPTGLLLQRPGDAVVADRVGRDVAFGPENLGLPRAAIGVRVSDALADVGFPYGPQTPTRALSGGETQRLGLAGALALRPGLLLLDEPTSMLDPPAAAAVRAAVLAVVAATGATLVVVEHRLGPWIDHVDRLVVLNRDGVVVCDRSPRDALRTDGDLLAAGGVWVPGLPAPEPAPVGAVVAALAALPEGPWVRAEALGVRLSTRGLRDTRVRQAIDRVDAAVPAGAVTALPGASGAGKSTLLAAMGGLLAPSAGVVLADPVLAGDLDPAPSRWRSPDLARRVGWVPQEPEHGFVTHRVADEVAATSRRLGQRVEPEALLDVLGLGAVAGADPYRLSGGEQRRLALVAGLAHGPAVALLDEPTVGQDRHTWAAVAGWVRALADSGRGVAVATHDPDLVAASPHEVVLDDGRVVRG